jgi:DTW domain-containing protein YfiP
VLRETGLSLTDSEWEKTKAQLKEKGLSLTDSQWEKAKALFKKKGVFDDLPALRPPQK